MLQTIVSSWDPYVPNDDVPWNLSRVHHLHRRAGFAATWDELQRDLAAGPDDSVDRLLSGVAPVKDFDALQELIGDAAVASDDIHRLQAWWFYRMLFSGDPLTERLTLLWHNHFATSNLKVKSVAMMKRQNDRLRMHAQGKFGDLLRSVVKDAAMMVWLDGKANRKSNPNENLARELMELFTLGEGNYKESDVKEVARALTGWTVRKGEFEVVDSYHDPGTKVFLGRRGRFDGDDVLQTLLDHSATATRLSVRLCEMFFGENAIGEEHIDRLASGLREHDLDIGWAVRKILRSQLFFADENIGNRISEPVVFIVGVLRALEMLDPPPSTLLLAEWSEKLGQSLFFPPNVFGWPGGRDWLSTRTMIGRVKLSSALIDGRLHRPTRPFDANALATKHGWDSDVPVMSYLCQLILGYERLNESGKPIRSVDQVLRLPEAQLC